jgi:hypothetical protein
MVRFTIHRSSVLSNDQSATRQRLPHLAGCMLYLFIGMGLLGTVAIAVDWARSLQSWFWEETVCTIESSEAVPRPEYGDYVFRVSYAFQWNGAEHEGRRYRPNYSGSEEYEARMLASRYRPGLDTACWFDTENPERSVLVRGNLFQGLWIFVPLLFVLTGFGALWLYRSLGKPADSGPGDQRIEDGQTAAGSNIAVFSVASREGRPKKEPLAFKSVAFLTGFFGLFFFVGVGFFLPFFVWPAIQVVEARSWISVPCEILESGVRTHSGDDGATYSIEVLFRYELKGHEYLSNRYHFLSGSTGGYQSKAEIVEKIPPGTRTVCYVDPETPHEAVLQRGFSGDFFFAVIPFVFVLVGAGGVVLVRAGAREAHRAATGPSWVEPPVRDYDSEGQGAVVLEPKVGPFGKLVGTIVIGLIWNGLVSLFVWQAIESWRLGSPDWFLMLFLSPFVLIGLLLAVGIPYQVLALANPRPRLRLSYVPLRPGEPAQVEWSFRGSAKRIRSLTISLQALRTEVTTEGSSVRSRTEPVTSIELTSRRRGHGLEFGAVSLEIPDRLEDGSPSVDDEISWKLKLHGDISYWPDVDEEYGLEVVEPSIPDRGSG